MQLATSTPIAPDTEGGIDEQKLVSDAAQPPLSAKTLALAAQLEAQRSAEQILHATGLTLAVAMRKLTGGLSIALTQEDYDNLTREFSVNLRPLADGEILSVALTPNEVQHVD